MGVKEQTEKKKKETREREKKDKQDEEDPTLFCDPTARNTNCPFFFTVCVDEDGRMIRTSL